LCNEAADDVTKSASRKCTNRVHKRQTGISARCFKSFSGRKHAMRALENFLSVKKNFFHPQREVFCPITGRVVPSCAANRTRFRSHKVFATFTRRFLTSGTQFALIARTETR